MLLAVPIDQPKSACSSCNLADLCLPIDLSAKEMHRLDELSTLKRSFSRNDYLYRSGDKFRSLYYDVDNEQKSGTFKVRIGQFAGEYLKALSQSRMGKDIATIQEEFQKALETGPRSYEVVITNDEGQRTCTARITCLILAQR